MSIKSKLITLAAKVALDRLMGRERTDELVRMLDDWKLERDKDGELAEAKTQAASPEAVREAVNSVAALAGDEIDEARRNELVFTVASGLAALERPPSGAQTVELLLPGKAKTFVVYLDDPRFTGGGTGRFFHFNWDGETYRVRDYIRKRILHPAAREERGKDGWRALPLGVSPLEIWNASKVRIHSTKGMGLGFGIEKQEDWVRILSLLTEAARQRDEQEVWRG